MSERGGAFLNHIEEHGAEWPEGVAPAICEHLGLTWEMADQVRDADDFEPNWPTFPRLADAIATLLEAAGVER